MTYTVKVTMPDGTGPELPAMSAEKLAKYLTSLGAKGWDPASPLPDTGRATADYEGPGDTVIEWSPATDES